MENNSDAKFQHTKHVLLGYQEKILQELIGEEFVQSVMGIDKHRFLPGSARRISYEIGVEKAKLDLRLIKGTPWELVADEWDELDISGL
jgi:hypothetical protein